MWTLHMANPETHWVPLATVASFRRMKEITGKDRDLAWVAESVRRYADKDEVEVDEIAACGGQGGNGGERMRRGSNPWIVAIGPAKEVLARGGIVRNRTYV